MKKLIRKVICAYLIRYDKDFASMLNENKEWLVKFQETADNGLIMAYEMSKELEAKGVKFTADHYKSMKIIEDTVIQRNIKLTELGITSNN